MENSFGIPIMPTQEETRLRKLESFTVLKTNSIPYYEQLAAAVAFKLQCPIAMINMVYSESVYTKGSFGIVEPKPVPRGISLCSLAILNTGLTVFEDTRKEGCLLANPIVQAEKGVQFYAAAPIVTAEGYAIGAVCVVDWKPKKLNNSQKEFMEKISDKVIKYLEFEVLPKSRYL